MERKSEEKMLSDMIRVLEGTILKDGKVDMDEAGVLLRLIRPMAEDYGGDFSAFEQVVRDVREDGVVTPEESERLRQLIAAMVDRADRYKVVQCPVCGRPLSVRTTDAGKTVCPWCGRTISL